LCGSRYDRVLVRTYYELPVAYPVPALAAQAVEQDIIPAPALTQPVMKDRFWEIADMGDVDLAGGRVPLGMVQAHRFR
jgi:hypothetical protein